MPVLQVRVNVTPEAAAAQNFVKEASSMLAEVLGKPEGYVTVSVETVAAMCFGGSLEPCAQVACVNIGRFTGKACDAISSKLALLLAKYFNVDKDRYYIDFRSQTTDMFGFCGKTFATL